MNHYSKPILLWIVMVVGLTLSCGKQAEQSNAMDSEPFVASIEKSGPKSRDTS